MDRASWPTIRLEEVCEHITVGHVGPMVDEYTEDGIPFLRSQNVRPFRFDPTELKFVSPEFHAKLKKSALRPKDVVVTRSGANTGQCCIIPPHLIDANCSDLVILRPSERINPWYLMYVLNSDWGRATIAGGVVGAAQHHFNIGVAKLFSIQLPPIKVQERIAGILSTYDDMIDNSLRRIQIFEEIARALYREWFVKFRFPGHETIPLVASSLGGVPKGWEVKKLGHLINYVRRAIRPGPHLADRRYVPIDCLPSRSLALLEAKPIEEAQSSLQLFEKGDVLFGAMRPYFHKVVVAPFAGVTRTTCFVFKPVQTEWNAFATMTIFEEATVAYANAHCQGATIPYAVWDGSLSEMPLVLPPDPLLRRFENVVAPILERISQSFFHQHNLRQTRDLLLQKLLTPHSYVAAALA